MTAVLDNCTYRACATLALVQRSDVKKELKRLDVVLAIQEPDGTLSLPYAHYGVGYPLVDPQSAMMNSFCYLTKIKQLEIEKTVMIYDDVDGGFLASFESSATASSISGQIMAEHNLKWAFIFDDKFDRLSKVTLIGLGLLPPKD